MIESESMFSKILGAIANSDTKDDTKLLEKIAKMDLIEMRTYVNGKLTQFEVNGLGLQEIIKKLISQNEDTEKYYIKDDDMDSKKKKAFDLLILILGQKKITITSLESAQNFLDIYNLIINTYDKENKQIYASKIKKAISSAAKQLDIKASISEHMNVVS